MKTLPRYVRLRGSSYRWEKRGEPRLGGGRAHKSLGVSCDHPRASALVHQRAAALQVCMDRGEWGILNRWLDGDVDITDIVSVVNSGDWRNLDREVRKAPTIREEVAGFLQSVEARRSARTYAQYESILGIMASHFGEDTRLDEVGVERAEEWIFGPQPTAPKGKWGRSTIRQVRQVCRQVWDRAIKREERRAMKVGGTPSVRMNPWSEIKPPKKPKTRAKHFTRDQWKGILSSIRGTPYALWMGCAFLAGLRQQEAARLKHSHWGRDRNCLHVPGTKTDRAVRDVPIPRQLWELYDEHVAQGLTGEEFVFVTPGRGDKPISSTTAVTWANEAYRMAGYEPGREGDGTYHSGRHSYATWLAQDNVSPVVGAALIGDTVQVYVDTYVHLVRADLEFAVRGLEESLGATTHGEPA